jgi:hypothetical protein
MPAEYRALVLKDGQMPLRAAAARFARQEFGNENQDLVAPT